MQAQPPALDMSSALTVLGDAVTRHVLEALAGTGLRTGHGFLVQRLLDGPATATEIARDLRVSQQAVSKSLAELVSLGHVEAVDDPADRRRHPVRLTARGRGAVARAPRARAGIDARLRETLGDERFDAMLADLVTALDVLGWGDRVRGRTVPPPGDEL